MSPALLPFGDPATSCHTALIVRDPSVGSRPKLALAA
jgi:hypothetical protein